VRREGSCVESAAPDGRTATTPVRELSGPVSTRSTVAENCHFRHRRLLPAQHRSFQTTEEQGGRDGPRFFPPYRRNDLFIRGDHGHGPPFRFGPHQPDDQFVGGL